MHAREAEHLAVSINVVIDVPHDAEYYLESSARLRCVSRTALIRRLVETILEEKLILSVLDDDDKPTEKKVTKHGSGVKRDMPPKDKLYDALKKHAPPVPHFPRTTVKRTNHEKMTRAVMERELRQAVLNTAALPVE